MLIILKWQVLKGLKQKNNVIIRTFFENVCGYFGERRYIDKRELTKTEMPSKRLLLCSR